MNGFKAKNNFSEGVEKWVENNMNTFQVKVPMSLKYGGCLETSLLTWLFHMNIKNLAIFIIVTLSPCS
jgi:hypothetical protein